jgi:hypothetical protein
MEVEYYAILTSYSIDQSHHKEDARGDMGGELMTTYTLVLKGRPRAKVLRPSKRVQRGALTGRYVVVARRNMRVLRARGRRDSSANVLRWWQEEKTWGPA